MGVERTGYGWRVRWTDPHGHRTCKGGFRRKLDADNYYKRILGDMARGEYLDPRAGRKTLAVWADEWLAGARNLSTGGHDTYRRDLDRHILPALGKVPIGKLAPSDLDRYLTEAGISLAPSTVHRHYRTLHRMLEVARQRGHIARNPAEHVQPPTIPKVQRQVLDPLQVDALADNISPRYRAWVYVMCYGGLRWSEAVGLRRMDVQTCEGPAVSAVSSRGAFGFESPPAINPGVGERPLPQSVGAITQDGYMGHGITRIKISSQLVHRGRGVWERCEPKAGSKRAVTLPAFAASELAGHLERFSLPGPDGLVFPTRNGTPVQSPSFTANVYKRALQRAGLPDLRIHDLRHTAVSLAIDAGANVKVGQARAGHASSRLHLDTYGHVYDGADEAVAVKLEELRAAALRGRLRAV